MKLLHEPLVHFLVAGALLFAAYAWLNHDEAAKASKADRVVRRLCPLLPVIFDLRITKDNSFQRFTISSLKCLQELPDVICRSGLTRRRSGTLQPSKA